MLLFCSVHVSVPFCSAPAGKAKENTHPTDKLLLLQRMDMFKYFQI